MNDTIPPAAQATAALARMFGDILQSDPRLDFERFENQAIDAGHKAMAEALGLALERLDFEVCVDLPKGQHVHDRRKRQLATKIGDVSFSYRRIKDEYGSTVVPLADALDLPWMCRISPAAKSFLVDAAAEVSYAKAARLMESVGGSHVSASSVMNALHQVGEMCAQADEAAAESLYARGAIPEARIQADQLSLEVDGTWFSLQGAGEGKPKRMEIKALVAFDGKVAKGGKVVRTNVVRHACFGTPEEFWTQGISAVGTKFDLSKIKQCHVGQDGEGWCGRAGEFLPGSARVSPHLDPFHINRAVLSCFSDSKAAGHILDVLWDGDATEAVSLLEACLNLGIAREKPTGRVLGYLRNNRDIIAAEGPSLGTMESENQHLYGSRMDSVPCAWSKQGASAMAHIRSRKYSGRELPRLTRENSLSAKRATRREKRMLEVLSRRGSGRVVQSEGLGYLPPHQASVSAMSAEMRYAAGIDSSMVRI